MRLCIYCGVEHDLTRDHLIPRSYSQNQSFKSTAANPIVDACRECNSTLNDKLFDTVAERAAYLRAQYRDKYKKELKWKQWSAEELAEMGSAHKAVIALKNSQAVIAARRIKRLELLQAGLDFDEVDPYIQRTFEHYTMEVVESPQELVKRKRVPKAAFIKPQSAKVKQSIRREERSRQALAKYHDALTASTHAYIFNCQQQMNKPQKIGYRSAQLYYLKQMESAIEQLLKRYQYPL